MITGCAACRLISAVIASTAFGSCPKEMPPHFTFGQEILISSMSTGSCARRSTVSQYSSVVCPQTFTMIFVSYCFRNGMSRLQNRSIPGFCRPIAFIIPLRISATRGVGLPGHGTFATPFVTTAPSLDKSTNSLYSIPEPKVPDAVITGFFKVTPAIFTLISAMFSPLPTAPHRPPEIPDLPCIHVCSLPGNAHQPLSTCRRRQDRLRFRRPSAPPSRSSTRFRLLSHMP